MRQFTAFAAAAVLAAMLSSGPAKADGYWSACPKPASAPVKHTARHQRHH